MEYKQQKKEKKLLKLKEEYSLEARKLNKLPIILFLVSLLMFLCFFLPFTSLDNTSVGTEASVNGYAYLFAGFSGNYTSPDSIYQDLAVPFYSHAREFCHSMASQTIVLFFSCVGLSIVFILSMVIKNYLMSIISTVTSIYVLIFTIVCNTTALSFKNGKILSDYCSGNKACSIGSFIVFPIIVMIIIVIASVVYCIMYTRIYK